MDLTKKKRIDIYLWPENRARGHPSDPWKKLQIKEQAKKNKDQKREEEEGNSQM